MGVTVIRDLQDAAMTFKLLRNEGKPIRDIIEESKYYRHPDSATISYAKITEESIGKISDKVLDIGIVGAGPSGICALYELSKIDHNQRIKVTLYENDDRNFIFTREFGDSIRTRAGRISSTIDSENVVYEVGAMRFPETASLTWYYAGVVFGEDTMVVPFPNPGAVTTEFVSGDRVDHYIGNDWEDPSSPTLKIKELVINKLWSGFYKIGNRTPEEVSSLLKGEDTSPPILAEIHRDWKTFVTKYDGMTLGAAVHKIISDSIGDLPGISGLKSSAEKVNYYFELFGHFGFGTGPFKPLFNISFAEMMRLILWNYSAEYLFPVVENVDFIHKLYNEAKNAKGFTIQREHVKVCDVFHRVSGNLAAGVAYYDLSENTSEPVTGELPKIKYHDYVIIAIPQVPATQIISRFGSTTHPIQDGQVGIPSIGTTPIGEDVLPPLMLSTKNGEEAANAQLISAIDSLHMIRSAKVFATIQKTKASEAPKFQEEPIQAVLSDCGLASSYMVPTVNEDYYSFLVSYTWEDDSTKQQYDYYDPSPREINSTVVNNNVFSKMIDRSYRWIRDVSVKDNRYKLWWLCDFLKSVEGSNKFFFDWTAQSSAGGFKLDLTEDHFRSDLCFRYHTHATSVTLNNRFFLASCSFSHLGGWIEGAFMSAINAVSGIVVSANDGNINALNTEAKKLFQDLESVV